MTALKKYMSISLYDRPEFFWCAGSSQMTVYENYTEFHPGYSCTSEERDQRQSEIDTACIRLYSRNRPLSRENMTEIRYVYEYLVNTVNYDENAPDNQNIYSALVGKNSVVRRIFPERHSIS